MEMLHYIQTMHYLPKVFIVNVLFQRKGNNFRNENTQLVPVNSLKSTLQWHLEGKTLKINNQNVHFKSVLKKRKAQKDYLDGRTAAWSPGAARENVGIYSTTSDKQLSVRLYYLTTSLVHIPYF